MTRLEGKGHVPELWGIHEIAAELDVRRETVHYHAGRDGFPEPVAELTMGRIWRADDVRAWAKTRAKAKGRR